MNENVTYTGSSLVTYVTHKQEVMGNSLHPRVALFTEVSASHSRIQMPEFRNNTEP